MVKSYKIQNFADTSNLHVLEKLDNLLLKSLCITVFLFYFGGVP